MRWVVCALLGALALSPAPARAQGAAPGTAAGAAAQGTSDAAAACPAPEHITHVEGALPNSAAAIAKDHRLNILLIGTGSSTLPGPDGANLAYPARLQAALQAGAKDVQISLKTDVKSRRTTADMVNDFQTILDAKPNLVIWQTGTFDAMRGVDPDEFRDTLKRGVKRLQAAGIDVLLVNMQYSPRTELMMTASAYAENMRWVAQQREVPLFDRLGLMRYWSEEAVFDFSAPEAASKVAQQVHNCIGKLLADLIMDTLKLGAAEKKGAQ
jgi:hypothetical protein